ncbi:MAG: class I adenylate-forming enzyme family protein, partial [Tepidisphaeraceae bacterium]
MTFLDTTFRGSGIARNRPPTSSYAGTPGEESIPTEARTIQELIDHHTQVRPDTAFLISPETGRILTFRQLQERSILLSRELRRAGLAAGDKVAFVLDNGLFTAELFLGAMYGGFVSVPLNVRAGASQLSYTLDHCDASIVYVSDSYADLMKEMLATMQRTVRVIPADEDGIFSASTTSLAAEAPFEPTPDDAALLMYSSGSTGRPKAAVHSHQTILAGGRNAVASHELTDSDRSLLVLPLYHINAECVTLIPTLLSGGSVVIPHRFSVSHFWDWLDEH